MVTADRGIKTMKAEKGQANEEYNSTKKEYKKKAISHSKEKKMRKLYVEKYKRTMGDKESSTNLKAPPDYNSKKKRKEKL